MLNIENRVLSYALCVDQAFHAIDENFRSKQHRIVRSVAGPIMLGLADRASLCSIRLDDTLFVFASVESRGDLRFYMQGLDRWWTWIWSEATSTWQVFKFEEL